jgi:hypothetical protein
MQSTRNAILSLVALGRVNAVEAERLIALCNQNRDEQTALAIGIAVLLLAFFHKLLPTLTQLAGALHPLASLLSNIALFTAHHFSGGIL